MTREDSIRTTTWVTEDGRYLTASEIADDHLRAIRNLLRSQLTPECNEDACRVALAACLAAAVARASNDYDYEEMDLDTFSVGWLQIVGAEIARRAACPA